MIITVPQNVVLVTELVGDMSDLTVVEARYKGITIREEEPGLYNIIRFGKKYYEHSNGGGWTVQPPFGSKSQYTFMEARSVILKMYEENEHEHG